MVLSPAKKCLHQNRHFSFRLGGPGYEAHTQASFSLFNAIKNGGKVTSTLYLVYFQEKLAFFSSNKEK